jgi:hypothetical protein
MYFWFDESQELHNARSSQGSWNIEGDFASVDQERQSPCTEADRIWRSLCEALERVGRGSASSGKTENLSEDPRASTEKEEMKKRAAAQCHLPGSPNHQGG